MLRTLLLICCLALLPFTRLSAQDHVIHWNKSWGWADSVLNTLTLDEKIAQLMTVAVWTQRDSNYLNDIDAIVRDCKVGGLMFMKGTPSKQARLTNRYQKSAKIPLLISIDGEWGVNMRLDSTPVFPRQLVLGAANDEALSQEIGREIGKQCSRLGIHLNYAPDADVNNNAANPVINDRSFGENKYIVARQAAALAKGMQEMRVIATAKHFPGHGDTETDSHEDLPVLPFSRYRLDSLELYPFKELIKHDVGAVMIAHLFVPAIDTTAHRATSISPLAVKQLLRNDLGFDGLAITDGLNMKGVANYAAPGEVCAKALAAGNDLLLFVEDVPMGIFWIKEYIKNGQIKEEDVNKACRKILVAKNWAGLNHYRPVPLGGLTDDLNCCSAELIIRKAVKKGIVVAKNQDNLIPLQRPDQYRIASVAVGVNQFTAFQQHLNNYLKADYYSIDKNNNQQSFDSLYSVLQRYNLVILSIHNTSRFVSKKLGLTQAQIQFINKVITSGKCVLVNNGNPYILQHFQKARNVIVSFEDLPVYNLMAVQALMGTYETTGKLPVSVLPAYPLGSGIETASLERLDYVMPEEMGYEHTPLQRIDSIVKEGLDQKAFPGCQVLVAKNGKVIYNKSFGHLSYDTLAQKTENYHLYDLASLTKMLSTTLAIMKLYEDKAIGLSDKLGLYLPFLRGTSKEKITIKDVMLHQAGFPAFIPFYKNLQTDYGLDTTWISKVKTATHTQAVADSIWINPSYEQVLFQTIAQCDMKPSGEYLYSDLGFILLRKLVENVSNQRFDEFMQENFYAPLALGSLCFNPLQKKVNRARIVPTEFDLSFRKQQVLGYVHDPAAALLGGVSGHAGLFSNANDVAVIMQMLLNGGTYGGVRVLKSSTIDLFTHKQNKKSRRGLGFDKPETNPLKASPAGKFCSPLAFGHTGFTGTCAWADPKNQLVYVFLSNRVNPSAENNKLAQMNIRTRIQDLIYLALQNQQ